MDSLWLGAGELQDLTEIEAGLGGAGSTAPFGGFSLLRGELCRKAFQRERRN